MILEMGYFNRGLAWTHSFGLIGSMGPNSIAQALVYHSVVAACISLALVFLISLKAIGTQS